MGRYNSLYHSKGEKTPSTLFELLDTYQNYQNSRLNIYKDTLESRFIIVSEMTPLHTNVTMKFSFSTPISPS